MDTGFDVFSWVILPLLIFCARLTDVTLNTLRHVFMSKGFRFRKIVPIIGFFEVLIWLIAISQVMKHLDTIACYIGFASGFAAGTYVGLLIEERMALGLQIFRLITNESCDALIEELRKEQYGVTIVPAQGAMGPVKIVFIVLERKDVEDVCRIVDKYLPAAFYTIEDVKEINRGVLHHNSGNTAFKRIISPRK